MSGLLAAITFLTRVPVRGRATDDGLTGAIAWFPVVGGLVGLSVAAAYTMAYPWMPSLLAALVAVGLGVIVTGALHEDGLADTADAFGSGTEGPRAIEIMRDSRLGTYGTLAVVLSVTWRVITVASMAPAAALGGLIAAHTLSRLASVAIMASTAPAAGEGLGRSGVAQATRNGVAASAVSGLLLTALSVGWWSIPALVLVTGSTLLVRAWARRRIGGVTGDVLGAAEQLGEMLTLGVTAVAVWNGSTPWWTV